MPGRRDPHRAWAMPGRSEGRVKVRSSNMTDSPQDTGPDDGLRRLLMWTVVALVGAVLLAGAFAWLAGYLFDIPR